MIQLNYAIFMAVWRRWFGGGFDRLGDNRFLQHLIGGGVACFVLWYNGYHWIQVVLAALVLQGLFWARSHGCCFDYGHGKVDESRYNQLWYWKYLKKMMPKSLWYTFYGDFFLMLIRYSLPAFVLAIILVSPLCLMMGICVASVYALCWIGYDFGWTKRPTEIAEYLAGFMAALLLGAALI